VPQVVWRADGTKAKAWTFKEFPKRLNEAMVGLPSNDKEILVTRSRGGIRRGVFRVSFEVGARPAALAG
jgi:hypothetical protein